MDKYIISLISVSVVILILLATGLYLVFHFLKNEKGTVIARGSMTHPGKDVQGTLLNDVNVASVTKTSMARVEDYRGISGLDASWYQFRIIFKTSPKHDNYQVLLSDADQNGNLNGVNNIISMATVDKGTESSGKFFNVTVVVKDEPTSTPGEYANSQNNFGFDFVVLES